jgi:GAF domain-containing protein
MAFTNELSQSLDDLDRRIGAEDHSVDSLEAILDKYLLEVEGASDSDIRTSVLLLDKDRKRLLHGAGPNLPREYCDSIHGLPIGPSAGSCGTAAYMGLWDDYRNLAQPHGLRACWSTPIRSDSDEVIGTFAIYHSTARAPTEEEILAIRGISGHVAQAITSFAESHAV